MIENTYVVITISIILFVFLYHLLIYPINKRLRLALNVLLAKEIARALYQKAHPEYTHEKKYRPDDLQSQLMLNTAIEEFLRISQKKEGNIQ